MIKRLKEWLRERKVRKLKRQLHPDCVMWQIQLDLGMHAPLGACTDCTEVLHKLRSMDMPVAQIR